MTTLHYSVDINAAPQHVWDTMLAPDTYKVWTAPFAEGSYYEGSWEQGQRIRFLTPNGEGMLGEIAENRQPEFLSIHHIGHLKDGEEHAMPPAYENYTFVPKDGGTELRIAMDSLPAYEAYMNEHWPKALAILKSISEGQ